MGKIELENLSEVFRYHAPKSGDGKKYEEINLSAALFAKVILEQCPDCSDRTVALRLIRNARMMANSSIALGGLI